MNTGEITNITDTHRTAIRTLVRAREDFQDMRKRMDNRIGRKADGTAQDVEEREFQAEDVENFQSIADSARAQERYIEKMLRDRLRQFKLYSDFLSQVKGVGDVSAGWIIAEYNIREATTVSKLWQFTGLNPEYVRGKKRVENNDGTFSLVTTDEMIRGDRLTPGFVAPFNKRLRTAMVGVLADGFIKAQSPYALNYYYPYKHRLANEEGWSSESPGHRDRAAKRYMIKMFLKDLYVAWRTLEGLPVRKPYQEEYLGHKHGE
jgi:hypothetical protein